MARIEFGLWANEQALFASVFLLATAIIAVAGQFPNWEVGLAAGCLSLPITLVEWSRPARSKGRVKPRSYQAPVTKLVSAAGRFGESYFVRFAVLVIAATAGVFSLPTLVPSVCLVFSALTYLFAAVRGEKWRPIDESKPPTQRLRPVIEAPKHPPPRPPPLQH